jgi:hypothetical protein
VADRLPAFPHGAVYLRKSKPPRGDSNVNRGGGWTHRVATDALDLAARFLTELVERYRHHAALGGQHI